MTSFTKDPNSIIDYSFDWADWLMDGDNILSTDWLVSPLEPGGLSTLDPFSDGSKRGTLVADGLKGHSYRLTCRITTADQRVVDRSITIKVMER